MSRIQVTYLQHADASGVLAVCDPAQVLGQLGRHGGDARWRELQDLYRQVYPRVADALSAWLDRVHGDQAPPRYWEILFYRFACPYVWEYLVRRQYLLALRETWPEAVIVGLAEADFEPLLHDGSFRGKSRRDDRFNLQWLSQIAAAEGLPVEAHSYGEFTHPRGGSTEAVTRRVRKGLRHRLATRYRQMRVRIASWTGKPTLAVLGGHFAQEIRDAIDIDPRYRSLHPVLPEEPQPQAGPPHAARGELAQCRTGDELADRILATLAFNLPRCYCEHLPQAPSAPLVDLAMVGFMPTLAERLWVAKGMRAGRLFCVVQHGAVYQEGGLFVFETGERRIADRFLGWGEALTDSRKVPAQRLPRFRRKGAGPAGEDVLLVMSEKSWFGYRVASCGREVQSQQEKFFAALDADSRRKIIARARPKRYGTLREQVGWLDAFPGIRVDDGSKPIAQAIGECGLVVLDRWYATTFQECLVADKPVLMFPGEGDGLPSAEATSYYDGLRAVGICHDSPESAAAAIKDILNSGIATWWNQPARRAAAERYRERYAYLGDDPARAWADLLHAMVLE